MEAAMRKIQKYDSSTIIPLFTQPRAAVVVVNLFWPSRLQPAPRSNHRAVAGTPTAQTVASKLIYSDVRLKSPTGGTLPRQLRKLAKNYQDIIYPLLFKTAVGTLKACSFNDKNLSEELAMTAILHTSHLHAST
ncbi:MAG: hypothetical protein ACJA0C_000368 [Candidatus Endobugula sp.]|jgi:hypothetical protein